MENNKEKSSFAKDTEEKNKKEPNIEEIQKKIEGLEKQKSEYLAGWQRERADFLNYKKEESERNNAIMVFKDGMIALSILPIMDNFEIVEKNLPEKLKEDDNIKGILR
jgi:molecular chaperone GrpE